MTLNIATITIDSTDPQVVAQFWSAALNTPVGPDATTTWSSVVLDNGTTLSFVAVPERKAVKNRVHIDLVANGLATDDLATEVARLCALGATEVSTYNEGGARWTTLRDVEGNEFCVVG